MRRRSPRFSALAVVAMAFFTDTFIYAMLVPLLPLYARTLGLGQVGLGLLYGGYAASLVLCTLPIGHWVDRSGRRAPFMWGLLGLGASTLIFAFSHQFILLLAARLFQGLAATLTWTAGLSLLSDHFPAERRGWAMGFCFACANAGLVLAPPVSGWLAESGGARAPFLFAAGLAGLDALVRLVLVPGQGRGEEGIPLGLGSLLRERTVWIFAGAMAAGAGLWALLEAVLPLHLDRHLGFGPRRIGLLFAAATLAHAFTSPFMGGLSDRWGRKPVLLTGLFACVVLLPLPAFSRTPWSLGAALMGLGVASSFIMSPASPALADAVERRGSRSFGSVFGLLNMAYALGMMVGPLVGSPLVAALGLGPALLVSGGACGLFALWLLRGWPRA